MNKEIRKLLQALHRQGCTIEHTNGRHVMVKGPRGGIVTISTNDSDTRRLLNTRAQVRRSLGIEL